MATSSIVDHTTSLQYVNKFNAELEQEIEKFNKLDDKLEKNVFN